MNQNNRPPLVKSVLDKELRTALNGLYDPAVMRNSPLITWFENAQENPVSTLRRVLLEGIEALRPQEKTPLGSKTWRVYQILRRRYTEQILQRQVADDLGISLRQLQREEKIAREVLRDHLWTTYHLDEKTHLPDTATPSQPELVHPNLVENINLEWLRNMSPVQDTDIQEVLQDGLLTLKNLLENTGVTVSYQPLKQPLHLYLQASILRQGLLNILYTAISKVPGGEIIIINNQLDSTIHIEIESKPLPDTSLVIQENTQSLDIARSFLSLCNASLDITDSTEPPAFRVDISLPITERITVLVIEDNIDTLQLFQRYLADSQYCFISAHSAQRGLSLAEELVPHLIVLDVMMPESDGWEVLGQIRVHPKTQHIPVIVCSIIPQSNLALSLGAVDFLQKPVNKINLLSALNRQMTRLQRGSG